MRTQAIVIDRRSDISFKGTINGLKFTYATNRKGWLRLQLEEEMRRQKWNVEVKLGFDKLYEEKFAGVPEEKRPRRRVSHWGGAPDQAGWCRKHGRKLDYANSYDTCKLRAGGKKVYFYDCEDCQREQERFGLLLRYVWLWYAQGSVLPPGLLGNEKQLKRLAERVRAE